MAVIPTTQIFLERLCLRLTASVGDERTDYTADGVTILAYQAEEAINRAVKGRYEVELKKIEDEMAKNDSEVDMQAAAERMMNNYKELQSKVIFNISHSTPDSTALPKPVTSASEQKIRRIKTIKLNTVAPLIENVTALPLNPDLYHRARTEKYSNYKPTYWNPRFYETFDSVEMMIDVNSSKIDNGKLEALCLLQPVYQKFDRSGDDIICPRTWESEIIEIAKAVLFGSKQQ